MRGYGGYEATKSGQELAKLTKAEALAHELVSEDYDCGIVINHLVQGGSPGYGEYEALQDAIGYLRSGLQEPEEIARFDQAMSIDLQESSWRYVGEKEGDTLFPIHALTRFAPASEDDQLILSGAAGLSLVNFGRTRCSLLDRDNFAELGFNTFYGFKTFNEASAFVGAYVVGRLVQADSHILSRYMPPSFSYEEANLKQTVSVGGTMHGDLEIAKNHTALSNILSPLNTQTEFGPQPTTFVRGYHSTEPGVVASLITAEFLRAGKAAALELTASFRDLLQRESGDDGNINFQRGNFADYGDGDVDSWLIRLRSLTDKDDYIPFNSESCLHREPNDFSQMFEIVATSEGIRFQNRGKESDEPTAHIDVGRQHYLELFQAVINQATAGLGRTSPSQLVNLTESAMYMLEAS